MASLDRRVISIVVALYGAGGCSARELPALPPPLPAPDAATAPDRPDAGVTIDAGTDAAVAVDAATMDAAPCGTELDRQGCPCEAVAETRGCFTGEPRDRGRGACRDGVQTCDGFEFLFWGACTGSVTVCEECVPGSVRIDLASDPAMPASLLSSEPIVLDTTRASEFVLDTGSSDDFALFAADGETPGLDVTGTQVTVHLPARYILLRDTGGYFGFEGDLEVVDGTGRRFFRTGWAQTRVPDLEAAGFPAQPFETPITAAQLRDLGWVDAEGVARVRLWLATDVGFLHVGVPTLLCE